MSHFSSLPSSRRKFFRHWSQRKTVVRALTLAGLLGPVLTVVLQGNIMLRGQGPMHLFTKIICTSVVIYGVASYSSACAIIDGERDKNSVSVTQPNPQKL